MRVSVRLQQSLWASALVLSLVVTQSPTAANGQSQSSNGNTSGDFVPPPAASTPSKTVDQAVQTKAKQALLSARQALAHGDVQTALQRLESAKQQPADFEQLGDSPLTVQAMIDRQNQLSELNQNRDKSYNANAASFLLKQAEALMYYQDFDTAEMLVKQARKFPVEFDATIGNPDQLEKVIKIARSNQGTQPTATSPTKKSEVMKYMSQARLAIDQKRWKDAQAFVAKAKALNLPESQFADNEARPWHLEFEIKNAIGQTFDPAVKQTSFESAAATESANPVVQANYNPATDTTKTQAASAIEESDILSTAGDFNPAANAVTEKETQEVDLEAARNQYNEKFRKLQSEIYRERAGADRLLQTNPRAALEKVVALRSRIAQSDLDANSLRPLLSIIDSDISEMQQYIEQNLPNIINDEKREQRLGEVARRRQRRVDIDEQLQALTNDFNQLVKEERFLEANAVARQAYDLDPTSPVVTVLIEKARSLERRALTTALRDGQEGGVWGSLHGAQRASIAPSDPNFAIEIGDPDRWNEITAKRLQALEARNSAGASQQIYNILQNQKVQGVYTGTLAEALEQLSRQANINIILDSFTLEAAGVRSDELINLPIQQPITLGSALNLMLQSQGLVYVVENEVIKVTTKEASQAELKNKVYYIGDLIMNYETPSHPMQIHFMQPNGPGSPGGFLNVPNNQRAPSPVHMAQQLGGAGGVNNLLAGGGVGNNNSTGQPTFGTVGGQAVGGITEADFGALIDLIQTTIQPDTWEDTGQGQGTIQPFANNLSLIVSQTQEVQDEIEELLAKLRQLNDVQIVVEVRFITLSDTFFERVGIDFDFSLNDNADATAVAADNVSPSSIIGRDNSDPFTPTGDLDIDFLQSSFGEALVATGGFLPGSGASLGFAILSDIEVFFLVEAAKGDSRSSVTEAPTVTMFNGQSASVTDNAQVPFVTSVVPVVGDFAVAHQPIITILPDGASLNVNAVVSDDRRFVRLQMVPFFSNVTEVNEFTFDGSTTTTTATDTVLDDLLDIVNGGGAADPGDDGLETETTGITVQLPTLAITSVNTVVSVPDGGTVLLGGIRRNTEERNEAGVPFLSSVPYINRLFKNVAIGQDTSNLMLMVTPRIIIQQEIEEDTVGPLPGN